jgi:carbonic anhydrase
MQSPIDLSKRRPERSLGFLNYAYHPAQATIVNRGHDIQCAAVAATTPACRKRMHARSISNEQKWPS